MKIYNEHQLKEAYELINMYMHLPDEYSIMKNPETIKAINEKIDTIKKDIREYRDRCAKETHFVIQSDCDGWVEKIILPEYIDSKDRADEWFEGNEYRVCIPSQYDCTGQAFTRWYRIFKIRDNWVAYHSIGLDV